MVVVDLEHNDLSGWAVGPRVNRKLDVRCWEQVRQQMASVAEGFGESGDHPP